MDIEFIPFAFDAIALTEFSLLEIGESPLGERYLIRNGVPQGDYRFERSGSVVADGVTFGENTPVENGGEYIHYGAVRNYVFPSDFSTWGTTRCELGGVVDGPFPGTHGVRVIPLGNDSWVIKYYSNELIEFNSTLFASVYVRATAPIQAGQVTYLYILKSLAAGSFDVTLEPVVLSQNWSRVVLPVDMTTGTYTGLQFRVDPPNIPVSDDPIEIALPMLTANYDVDPIYIETETSAGAIDTAASNATGLHGLTWTCPAGTELNEALTTNGNSVVLQDLLIRPTLAQKATAADINILSGDSGNKILYVDGTTGGLKLTDGTNTVTGPAYTPDTKQNIQLEFVSDEMRLIVDGVPTAKVPFVGAFNPGDVLKFALDNEDLCKVKNVYYFAIEDFEQYTVTQDGLIVTQDGDIVTL